MVVLWKEEARIWLEMPFSFFFMGVLKAAFQSVFLCMIAFKRPSK